MFPIRLWYFRATAHVLECYDLVEQSVLQVVETSAILGYDVIKPGRWYQFRVAAVNAYGSQGWSRPSAPFTSTASEYRLSYIFMRAPGLYLALFFVAMSMKSLFCLSRVEAFSIRVAIEINEIPYIPTIHSLFAFLTYSDK